MRKKYLVGLILLCLSFFLFLIGSNLKVRNTEKLNPITSIKDVNNKHHSSCLIVKSTFQKIEYVLSSKLFREQGSSIVFNRSGQLLRGSEQLSKGDRFKKNQLLFRLNNREAFYELKNKKIILKNIINETLKEYSELFPNHTKKWIDFSDSIKPSSRLPVFPEIFSSKEKDFLIKNNIISAYSSIEADEIEMEKYFYLAPFDGYVVSINVKESEKIDSGQIIAKISSSSNFVSKLTLQNNQIQELNSDVEFLAMTNNQIGKGKLLRIDKKGTIETSDVYISFHPNSAIQFKEGDDVKIKFWLNKKCIKLPKKAIRSNKVKVLIKGKIVEKPIVILKYFEAYAYTEGLKNGDKIVVK